MCVVASTVMLSVFYCRRDRQRFTIVLVGNDTLVSSTVQALVTASCSPNILHFVIIPIGKS